MEEIRGGGKSHGKSASVQMPSEVGPDDQLAVIDGEMSLLDEKPSLVTKLREEGLADLADKIEEARAQDRRRRVSRRKKRKSARRSRRNNR
jgi:hypothetical protein